MAWRNNADVAEKYIRKGTQLYIEGRIRTRSWDDQTGNKRYTTEIIADTVQLLGKKSDNPASQGGAYTPSQQNGGYQQNSGYQQAPAYQQPQSYAQPVQQAAPAAPQVEDSFSDDDLPF